jgi:hypothetical protein
MNHTVTEAVRSWLECKGELNELSKRRTALNKQKKECEQVLTQFLEESDTPVLEFEGHKLTLKTAVVEE